VDNILCVSALELLLLPKQARKVAHRHFAEVPLKHFIILAERAAECSCTCRTRIVAVSDTGIEKKLSLLIFVSF